MAQRLAISKSEPATNPPTTKLESNEPRALSFGSRIGLTFAVLGLLGLHLWLAITSLRQENPTVDEVLHLPAGVSYWQKGTFKLYHHNPPLVKLIAALPVVLDQPKTARLYEMDAWREDSQAGFGHFFALDNSDRYFEYFDRARMMMPLFTVIGGLGIFFWSSRLYGPWGGLLSLTLWCLCPNILANGRLITTDVAASSFAVVATYLFWRYQQNPSWVRVVLAGLFLGLAQLTKFSMILLYGIWPALAILRFLIHANWQDWPKRWLIGLAQWLTMVVVSVLVIDSGYAFEGVGTQLGKFEFVSRSLTRPVTPGMARPTSSNPLLRGAWRYRVNRFRGTILGSIPCPLPRHYVLGFDEQKIETEGVPLYFFNDSLPRDESVVGGYPVYLDGVLRDSGWWYYYLATLAYKVPEGSWFLVGLSGFVLIASKRSRASWPDEIAVLAIPVGVLLAMSFLTDICLGLRYILPIFPFVYVSVGKVAPWANGLAGRWKWAGRGLIGAALLATIAASASIYPDYLAYFNWASGGPDRGANHLIDSNLDWGQDLVKLNRWLKQNRPGQRVGLAYFGQINPTLLTLRGDGFDWFLPPVLPGSSIETTGIGTEYMDGPAARLKPGLYAVSASVVQGLPWRFYDSRSLQGRHIPWLPGWRIGENAFGYFRQLTPVARVGRSIYVYDVSTDDCARLAPLWTGARVPVKSE